MMRSVLALLLTAVTVQALSINSAAKKTKGKWCILGVCSDSGKEEKETTQVNPGCESACGDFRCGANDGSSYRPCYSTCCLNALGHYDPVQNEQTCACDFDCWSPHGSSVMSYRGKCHDTCCGSHEAYRAPQSDAPLATWNEETTGEINKLSGVHDAMHSSNDAFQRVKEIEDKRIQEELAESEHEKRRIEEEREEEQAEKENLNHKKEEEQAEKDHQKEEDPAEKDHQKEEDQEEEERRKQEEEQLREREERQKREDEKEQQAEREHEERQKREDEEERRKREEEEEEDPARAERRKREEEEEHARGLEHILEKQEALEKGQESTSQF